MNIVVPDRLDEKPLRALKLGEAFDLKLLGLMRGTEYMPCDNADLVLRRDDKLLLLGKRPELRRFGDTL